jgi:methyl-accepting chemotaxis protein
MYVPGSLDLQYQAAQFFMIILERLPFALFLLLALIFVHQMLIAHRFCGPIINFSHTIRRVTRGDLTRTVRLRRYDFFKEEERYLNDMLHELSHRIGSIKKDHENLARALEDITIQAADSPQAQRSVQALKTALEHSRGMEEHLSVFRLPGEGGGRPRTDLKEAVGDRMVSGRKGQIPPAGTKALGAKAPNAA